MRSNKKTRPLIGIPCARLDRGNGRTLHYIANTYIDALLALGAVPLLIPATDDEAVLLEAYQAVDGLLLSGGVDLNPAYYGEEIAGSIEIDDTRDIAEIKLSRWAIVDDLPVLGICRGQQLLNVALGGSLYQDIPTNIPETKQNHQESGNRQQRDYLAHHVELEADSKLAAIMGVTGLKVNTLHHQSVKQVAQGLKIVGRAPDGVIEALEAPQNRYVVTVQWHPEELWRTQEAARRLFVSFIEEVKGRTEN
jgi:putative glutamine amidotransferase